MRPINRGTIPPAPFKHYRDAFPALETNLGPYCSYCERQIETHLAIEHVQPKSKQKSLELTWDNFLLACTNCNSCKGDEDIVIDNYLWPDVNNLLLALNYHSSIITNALSQNHPAHQHVHALIKLVGLDKDPGNLDRKRKPEITDQRWKYRFETLNKATKTKQRLSGSDSEALREQIVETALSHGGFSIWFSVFLDDTDMCLRLITAFPGTAGDCFDNGRPIERPGALL
jgi:hypothetical protein